MHFWVCPLVGKVQGASRATPSGQTGSADSRPVGVTPLGCCFFSSPTAYLFMTQVTTYRPHDSWWPKDEGRGGGTHGGCDGAGCKWKSSKSSLPVVESLGAGWVLLDQGRFQTYVVDMSQGQPFKFSVGCFLFPPWVISQKIFQDWGAGIPVRFLTGLPLPSTNTGCPQPPWAPVLSEQVGLGGGSFWNGSHGVGASTPAACAVLTGVWSMFFPLSHADGLPFPRPHPSP